MCHLFDRSARAVIFIYSSDKKTQLVEDVEILLPVKFLWIPFSSFRGEVNKRPIWATVAHLSTMNASKIWHQNGTKNNKSPKGHWSLTWVQWALLLKVRFLRKSESKTAIFVKSVRTATIAIFQFTIRGCIRFVAVAFRSEEEVLWRRNPSLNYFWQIAPPLWIRPWVEFAERPIKRCLIMSTSSLSSFVNIHQVVL